MTLMPLIVRELRSAARQPFTYSLRMLGAGALLATSAFIAVDGGAEAEHGSYVFARLHSTLFIAIWVLVPLLVADCISRERREGTLPLLFLTPVRPRHIIMAKGMAHGLRALTLWLAVLPVLTIPFIAGGVSWMEAVLSLLVNFSSICLAMGAGLLASSRSRVWMRALAGAGCFALLLFVGFMLGLGMTVGSMGAAVPYGLVANPTLFEPGPLFGSGLSLALDMQSCWQLLFGATVPRWLVAAGYFPPGRVPPPTNVPLLLEFGLVMLLSLLAFLLIIRIAAWNMRRAWREEAPSEGLERMRRKFCTPVAFLPVFKCWMRWELQRNPMGWLERRTWSARLVTWSWFAVLVSVYSSLLANLQLYSRGFHAIQTVLAWLLVLSVALGSSGSFCRERETGVLELLLVSPLREWQIIGGRVCGLWVQFMPATLLLVSVWLYCASFLAPHEHEWSSVLFYGTTLLTMPVLGLYHSLVCNNFLSAFLRTLLLGVAVPVFLARLDDFLNLVLWLAGQPSLPFQVPGSKSLLATPIQLALAGFCAWRLQRNLKRRKFALERLNL